MVFQGFKNHTLFELQLCPALALEGIHDCHQKIETDGLKDHVSLACVIQSLLERAEIYYVVTSSRTMGPWPMSFMLMNPVSHMRYWR